MEEKNNIISEEEATTSLDTAEETTQPAEPAEADSSEAVDAQQEEPAEYVPQFGEIEGVSLQTQGETAVKVKKKRFLMPCIIISACVLLVAVIIGVVFLLFFNTSVTGTYVIEDDGQSAQVQTYFILEEDGLLTQRSGSVELEGTYELSNENGVNKITFEIPANYVNVTYNYKLEGNRITGIKMLLSDDNGNSMIFAPATYTETVVEPIEKAQLDSKLVGKWEDSAGYGLTYTFNDDYSLVMSGNGMNIYGYYSAENGTVKIKYQANEVVESSATYSFKDDTLVLNNLEFKRVSE